MTVRSDDSPLPAPRAPRDVLLTMLYVEIDELVTPALGVARAALLEVGWKTIIETIEQHGFRIELA